MAANHLSYGSAGNNMRWSTPAVAGKSVEIQRSQVDELFKSMKDGDDLVETEPRAYTYQTRSSSCSLFYPAPEVATKLYPHQKKALTFLLERERERCGADGKFSSLWQLRTSPSSRRSSWFHIVTQKEVFEEPREAKGAILADDVCWFLLRYDEFTHSQQMGLGKTITCVSLIAATLASAKAFGASPVEGVARLPRTSSPPDPSQFSGSVWGMPCTEPGTSQKSQLQVAKEQDRMGSEYARANRIKAKSRATLIVCPLSTVSNWEDQFREHWRCKVTVVGGGGSNCTPVAPSSSIGQLSLSAPPVDAESELHMTRSREGTPLRVYIYHGNARRPDPAFLADFDAVITTFATLASEFSRQSRAAAIVEDEDDAVSDGPSGADVDDVSSQTSGLPKIKKGGLKRKKSAAILGLSQTETTSPLQSIHWFRVVLDEAQ